MRKPGSIRKEKHYFNQHSQFGQISGRTHSRNRRPGGEKGCSVGTNAYGKKPGWEPRNSENKPPANQRGAKSEEDREIHILLVDRGTRTPTNRPQKKQSPGDSTHHKQKRPDACSRSPSGEKVSPTKRWIIAKLKKDRKAQQLVPNPRKAFSTVPKRKDSRAKGKVGGTCSGGKKKKKQG